MHDPLSIHDLVSDELEQRRTTGFDVSAAAARLSEVDQSDSEALRDLYGGLLRTTRGDDWSYDEPNAWPEIVARLAVQNADRTPGSLPHDLEDRISGGWLGRIAGCNLGKPFETGIDWTPDRIRAYLESVDAYPLLDYVPVSDPTPDGWRFHPSWPETTRGRVHGSARDDDIDYTILGLDLLERHGPELTTADVANAWLAYLPYLRVYTAERAVYVNLLHGHPAEAAADVRNPYREWIGAQIRGDVYGWVLPGRPFAAAELAHVDASLSHRENGLYGELWSAALLSCATVADSVQEAFDRSLAVIPPRSRLAEVLGEVRQAYAAGQTWQETIEEVRARYGHLSWVHTLNNAGVLAAGLLWGESDFAATVGLTVQGGWDTDSNGATAGAVAGTVLGAAALPAHFVEPLDDRVRSAVFGYDHSRISELATRTLELARRWPR